MRAATVMILGILSFMGSALGSGLDDGPDGEADRARCLFLLRKPPYMRVTDDHVDFTDEAKRFLIAQVDRLDRDGLTTAAPLGNSRDSTKLEAPLARYVAAQSQRQIEDFDERSLLRGEEPFDEYSREVMPRHMGMFVQTLRYDLTYWNAKRPEVRALAALNLLRTLRAYTKNETLYASVDPAQIDIYETIAARVFPGLKLGHDAYEIFSDPVRGLPAYLTILSDLNLALPEIFDRLARGIDLYEGESRLIQDVFRMVNQYREFSEDDWREIALPSKARAMRAQLETFFTFVPKLQRPSLAVAARLYWRLKLIEHPGDESALKKLLRVSPLWQSVLQFYPARDSDVPVSGLAPLGDVIEGADAYSRAENTAILRHLITNSYFTRAIEFLNAPATNDWFHDFVDQRDALKLKGFADSRLRYYLSHRLDPETGRPPTEDSIVNLFTTSMRVNEHEPVLDELHLASKSAQVRELAAESLLTVIRRYAD